MSLQKSGEGGAGGSEEKKRLAPLEIMCYIMLYLVFYIMLYLVFDLSFLLLGDLWGSLGISGNHYISCRRNKKVVESSKYVDLSGVYRV
jgi:hypothetical protein